MWRASAIAMSLTLALVVAVVAVRPDGSRDQVVTSVVPTGNRLGTRLPSSTIQPPPDVDRSAELAAAAHAAYVGWFDAVYRGDLGALTSWVATDELYRAGIAAIDQGSISFTAPPLPSYVGLAVDEVLLDRTDCVVLVITDDVGRFIDAAVQSRSVITVYWPDQRGRLRTATRWGVGTPQSVWSTDCDHRARDFTP